MCMYEPTHVLYINCRHVLRGTRLVNHRHVPMALKTDHLHGTCQVHCTWNFALLLTCAAAYARGRCMKSGIPVRICVTPSSRDDSAMLKHACCSSAPLASTGYDMWPSDSTSLCTIDASKRYATMPQCRGSLSVRAAGVSKQYAHNPLLQWGKGVGHQPTPVASEQYTPSALSVSYTSLASRRSGPQYTPLLAAPSACSAV